MEYTVKWKMVVKSVKAKVAPTEVWALGETPETASFWLPLRGGTHGAQIQCGGGQMK